MDDATRPTAPRGPEIAAALRQLQLAVFRGDVELDAARLESWPPGARLALDQCARRAAARGHRFVVRGAQAA
ncbi:hypothetical protein [Modestobacter sp. Leaf380]|uniref:hypothetical protein n=1 Tax=Modestobacter sp. Leaf380 TaxID=1736356 RepID=UPI0006FC1BD4|nr:hypothetical protein [Modestobacter sp. Leaf380]KQS68486.1 hypothetical protein ASG41_05815 [Modestobacter sp. Leaf380]